LHHNHHGDCFSKFARSKNLVIFSKTLEKLVEFTLEKHFFPKIPQFIFQKKILKLSPKKSLTITSKNAIIFNLFGSKTA
jgi:hypothetical protein